jgi:hypothetical protein
VQAATAMVATAAAVLTAATEVTDANGLASA